MGLNKHTVSNEAQLTAGWATVESDHASDDYSTLILDRFGRIRSCGESAASMFHMDRERLVGLSAADLIPDLFENSAPRDYRTRQLADLARDSSWRPSQITDSDGYSYAVDLCLSCVETKGEEFFLAHLHRVDEDETV